MTAPTRPQAPGLIELWVRANRRWHLVETIDPAAPQFSSSPSPADYAWFEAMRLAARLRQAEPGIERCAVRHTAARIEEAPHGVD